MQSDWDAQCWLLSAAEEQEEGCETLTLGLISALKSYTFKNIFVVIFFSFFYLFCQIGGGRNSHEVVLKVADMVIKESRAARVQPFNEYRKKFNLKPYTSFDEFTGKQG